MINFARPTGAGGESTIRSLRLSTKIAVLSTILVLVSISAATGLFYAYSASMARKNALEASEESGRVMSTILEERIRGVLRLTLASFASGAKQTILERFLADPSPENTASALTEIAGRLIDITTSDPFIASVYLETPKGAFYSFADILKPGFSLRDSALFREASPHLREGPYWGGVRPDPIFSGDREVAPMVLLFNLPTRAEDLYLVLSLDARAMKKEIEKSLPDNAEALLLDRGGASVVSSAEDPGELERACARLFANGGPAGADGAAQGSGSATIELGGKPALMTWRPLNVVPWVLVDARSLGSLQEDLKRMRDYAVAVCVILVAIGLAMSAAIAGGTTRALHRLEGAMRRAESGDLAARCEVGVGDEVAWLGTRFNSMLDEIGGLVGELHDTIGELESKREALREEQTQKRRAELAALQAQINPHFLYNTLNTIIWMADREKVPQIAELAANLGTFFRISLSRGAERITLADELEQVRSYLVVQKARHGDALSYGVELSPLIASTSVVKLIVQPLVENSIEHGIMEGLGRGRVTVTAAPSEDGKGAVVRVDDDGVGMEVATLEETNARLAAGEGGGEAGYGIYNVNERLRLEYGAEWGLRYALLQGGGLRAELRFPLAEACT